MHSHRLLFALLLALSPASLRGAPQPSAVSESEFRQWQRWLLPLPKQVRIEQKVPLASGSVVVRLRPGADEVEQQAAADLQRALGAPSGSPSFEVFIGVQDATWTPGAISGTQHEQLKQAPNNRQAYLIQPAASGGLLLTGLSSNGVYYAARTLMQLLEAPAAAGRLEIPLAHILDWPDLDERGLWNFPDAASWIPWMASLKLNYGNMTSTRLQTIERGKPNRVSIDSKLYATARRMGFHYLPFIVHMNFLHDAGMFRAYPELAGQGDEALAGRYFAHKRGNQHRVPFAGSPQFRQILTEWIGDLASQNVREVGCWLTERPAQDQRPETTAAGQFVLEGRAIVGAWNEARRKHPGLGLRLFLSTVTTERDYRVIAEAPPEVKIERACATALERVTHLPRDLFRYPLLDHYAAQGRWVASYDVPLAANARVDTPEFMVPQSSVHRVRDYVRQLVERRYSGAYGMLAWANKARETYAFSTAALAEYGWNSNGRTPREFAATWATREGHEDPERFADWSELMGPVEFDVYDSDFPISYSWDKFIAMIKERRRPYLGEGVFRYFSSIADFDAKTAACDRAAGIAGTFRNSYFADETRVVRSYVQLARKLYEIAEHTALDPLSTPESQRKLRQSLNGLEAAGKENAAAIRRWRTALGPESWESGARPREAAPAASDIQRAADAIWGTEHTVAEIKDYLEGRYFN